MLLRKAGSILLLTAVALAALGCSRLGTKVPIGKSDVYYTPTSSEADARKLGAFLTSVGFFSDSNAYAVQIGKDNGTTVVKVAIAPNSGLENNQTLIESLAFMGGAYSARVLNGGKAEFQIADNHFKTLKPVPPLSLGKAVEGGGRVVYYTGAATEADAKKALDLIQKVKWDGDVLLSKEGDTFRPLFATTKGFENDAASMEKLMQVGQAMADALGTQKLVVVVGDSKYSTVKEFPLAPPAAANPPPAAAEAPPPAEEATNP